MSTPTSYHGIVKIVSGGQTGVDRAALDTAIRLEIPHGGWCPQGRLAEDGRIPAQYQLEEMDSTDYKIRTEQNVIDSDGTLILYRSRLQGGTLLTNRLAKHHDKPLYRIRMDRKVNYTSAVDWILQHRIRILNVAGPRGSSDPDLESQAATHLEAVLKHAPTLPIEL